MTSQITSLINELNCICKWPRLYISEYFYSIINEIDIHTETSLLNLSLLHRDENNFEKCRSVLNHLRESMITSLKEKERTCLENSSIVSQHERNENQLEVLEWYKSLSKTTFKEPDLSNIEKVLIDKIDELKQLIFANKTIIFLNLSNNDTSLSSIKGTDFYDKILNEYGHLLCIEDVYTTHRSISVLNALFNSQINQMDFQRINIFGLTLQKMFSSETKDYNLEENTASILNRTVSLMLNLSKFFFEIKRTNLKERKYSLSDFDSLARDKIIFLNSAKLDELSQREYGLAINECSIESIETSFFSSSFLNIRNLNLSNNKLSAIGRQFDNLVNLNDLNLSKNRICFMDDAAFKKLENLKYLNLSQNQLEKLPSNLFKYQKQLVDLDLSANQLQYLESSIFMELSTLRTLRLKMNCIETLEEDTFSGLSGLVELHLNLNRIRYIHSKAFHQLRELKILNLEKNQIYDLSESLFDNLTMLCELKIAFNFIYQISNHTFGIFLRKLKQLHLNNNQINSVDENAFDHLVSLELLDLSNNQLCKLNSDSFKRMPNKIQFLYLKGNPFCSNRQTFLNQVAQYYQSPLLGTSPAIISLRFVF